MLVLPLFVVEQINNIVQIAILKIQQLDVVISLVYCKRTADFCGRVTEQPFHIDAYRQVSILIVLTINQNIRRSGLPLEEEHEEDEHFTANLT